jgi:hypothetical protein
VPVATTLTDAQWFSDRRCAGAGVPVWAFHSVNDAGPTDYSNSKTLVEQLNACVPAPAEPAQVDLGNWWLENQGHAGFFETYSDTHGKVHGTFTSIYAWLLAHAR